MITRAQHQSEAEISPTAPRRPSVDVAHFGADLREAGIEEMLGPLLKTFAEDSPGKLAALELALAARDADAVRSAAHAFKSGAGTVRANHLAELLQSLELDARTTDVETTAKMLEQIRAEHLAVHRELALAIANAG